MRPKSFSASSLAVAEGCLARYKAEHIDRASAFQGTAANVGIVCHGTLEKFVRDYAITRSIGWNFSTFEAHFHETYDEVFGSDRSLPEYADAHTLSLDWFNREGQQEKIDSRKVISVESKSNFPLRTPYGEIPVNYIMDRLDRIGPKEYCVVDYKSQRVPFTTAQMRKKIQPRLYSLATQIMYPDAESIWVEYDFLRHSPVSIEFRRADNEETYRMIRRAARIILETDDEDVTETLNPECGWCIRKASCKALLSNAAAGGITGKSIDELAVLHNILKSKIAAEGYLLSEIEQLLLNFAAETDQLTFDTDRTTVSVTSPARRQLDHDAIRRILGPELASKNGTFRAAEIDKLIKDKKVDAATANQLRAAMPKVVNELGIKVELNL